MSLMDIDLTGVAVDRHKIITCEIEGIVDEDDLRAMAMGQFGIGTAAGEGGDALDQSQTPAPQQPLDDPTNLSKIREKWHNVARLLSKGMSVKLTAAITGYDEGYLSVLMNNPAMQELMEMYRVQAGGAAEVITEKLRTVGTKALERLDARIDADTLNNNELIQASKLGLDRAGHGPSMRQVSETHIIDHAAIAEQMRKARIGSREYIVPVNEVREALRLPSKAEEAE